ncbi:MAG: tetratricopeptide repeat protein [bacterium]
MGFDYKAKAREAVEAGELDGAVAQLKKALSENPYWGEGHRLLGDIYLFKLEHYSYALVEYRKLRRVSDEVDSLDRLKLAWAYHRRDFEDKAARILQDIDKNTLPESTGIMGETFDVFEVFEKLNKETTDKLQESNEKYFKKYSRQGREYMHAGNFYRAEKNFKKALDYSDSARARLDLARCQVQRVKFPRAIENLKMLRSRDQFRAEAEELLDEIYERLGLPVQYSEKSENESIDVREDYKTG